MNRVVWWNGNFIQESEAKVSIYDSAMMYGDTIFTMMRTFNRKVFQLDAHLDRLYENLKYVHLKMPYSREQMTDAVMQTMDANQATMQPDDEHRLMINVTRGLMSIYQDVVGVSKGMNVIIADFPLRWTVRGMSKFYQHGINAVIPSQRAIPANLLDPKVKSRSRLHYLMANIEVADHLGDNNWALLLDPDGFITEGTGANFFIVDKKGTLITPEPRNVLRGISRAYVMSIIWGDCKVKNIELYDVVNAREAFFTGTPFCILPVTSINNQTIGSGKIGNITEDLLNIWGKNVGVDIVKQITDWDIDIDIKSEKYVSPYVFKKETNEIDGNK
jgi:branched-chain amino acid aminotransferase